MMNSRERVFTILDKKEADRVPVQAHYVPQVTAELEKRYNRKGYDLQTHLGNDILLVQFGVSNGFYKENSETYVDDFGITYRNTGLYTEIHKSPLDTDEKVETFSPPPIDEVKVAQKINSIIEEYGKEYIIAGKISQTMFESSWMLRGLDRFLMDVAINPDLALSLMDKLLNYHKTLGKILVKQGVDLIYSGDDVGAQNGMLISPDFFRQHMKPRYQTLWAELKSINPNLFIAHHTCGHVVPIIDDFIEAGLDILNPLQPKAMDIYAIKKRYGDRLSFWGGVDIQHTLPFGNRESIYREIQQLAQGMGKNGGYIISPAHAIQYDTSVENIEYFYQAAKEYGVYG